MGGFRTNRLTAKRAMLSLLAALGVVSSVPAWAIVYHIDSFSEGTAAGAFFLDSFSDGIPPPSAPNFVNGTPAAYAVSGSFSPTAETGGKLAIDTSLGVFSTPFLGITVQAVNATLITSGLTQGVNFFVQGRFDLSQLPVAPVENFGIRVGDIGIGNGNGVVDLLLRPHNDNLVYIDLLERDFLNAVTTQIASIPLAPLLALHPTADQIDFTLGHAIGATEMGAAYALLSGGSVLASSLISATAGNLFDGESTVRGGFFGVARAVPEPATLLLLGIALGALSFAGRKRN